MSFNCLVLSTDSLVPIAISKDNEGKFVILGQRKASLKGFTVVLLRNYICEMKNIANFDDMKLWKINNVKMSNIKDRNISTEDDVKNKLNGEEMVLTNLFRRYFKDELDRVDSQDDDDEFVENIHIIATIISATGKCLPMFYFSNKKQNIEFGLISFFRVKAGPCVPQGTVSQLNDFEYWNDVKKISIKSLTYYWF